MGWLEGIIDFIFGGSYASTNESTQEIEEINSHLNTYDLTDKEYYNGFVEAFYHNEYCEILKRKKELNCSLTYDEKDYLKYAETVRFCSPPHPFGSEIVNLGEKSIRMESSCNYYPGKSRDEYNKYKYFIYEMGSGWYSLTRENKDKMERLVELQEELMELEEKYAPENEWD